jgi:hypothetical protein
MSAAATAPPPSSLLAPSRLDVTGADIDLEQIFT